MNYIDPKKRTDILLLRLKMEYPNNPFNSLCHVFTEDFVSSIGLLQVTEGD